MSRIYVDFLIIGGAKCATTWLQNSLQRSDGIEMPDPELHYFSRNYDRGAVWYAEQLPNAGDEVLIGEKSNSYLTEVEAAERIKSDLPDVKLIVQMRNPVERAYSDYCMLFRRGEVDDDVRTHLDPDRAADDRFIHDGRYAMHLSRFLELFPSERFLYLLFEDVAQAPEWQLEKLAQHIGYRAKLAAPVSAKVKDKTAAHVPAPMRRALRPLRPILDPVRNTAPVKALRNLVAKPFEYPPLPKDVRDALVEFYAPEIEQLEALTGLDLSRWT